MSRPLLLIGLLTFALLSNACVQRPPRGMSGQATMHSGDAASSVAELLDATQAVLRDRYDTWDLEGDGNTTATLLTGRARIEITARDEGGSHLRVYLQELVGRDHDAQAEQLWQRIVDRAGER